MTMGLVIKESRNCVGSSPNSKYDITHFDVTQNGVMRPQRTIGFLSCHYTADCGGSIGYCTVVEDRPRLHGSPITLH